ncbi:AAA family ATPase [Chloroflexota bacterium]
MPVKNLEIRMLGPFDTIEFDFDMHVNVFIGPNNCGKTTALIALAEAVTYPFVVPERYFRGVKIPYLKTISWDERMQVKHVPPWVVNSADVKLMKKLGYTGFIPALRENTGFRPKSPMGEATNDSRKRRGIESELYEFEMGTREDTLFQRHQYTISEKNKTLTAGEKKELERRKPWSSNAYRVSRITDEEVVSKMVELDYRSYRKDDTRFRDVVSVIARIASEIMIGFPVNFQRIEEEDSSLYPQFTTPNGHLPLDKLSQGTQSIIQWLSRLVLGMAEYYDFPKDLTKKPAIFIIDEIDAHMHPEWQRRIIPTITKNLPNCQLFVSTHSPLILSGLSEGQVQLLNRGRKNRIEVTTNEFETVGWSVDETMRWLLGMKGTFDSETEKAVDKLESLRVKSRLTKAEKEQLGSLRQEIHERLAPK